MSTQPTEITPSRRLLIVEPNRLTQWSLRTYLQRWFVVDVVATADEAARELKRRSYSAVLISDELPAERAEQVEHGARSANGEVISVRLVTGVSRLSAQPPQTVCVEKPFELSRLAEVLGVG